MTVKIRPTQARNAKAWSLHVSGDVSSRQAILELLRAAEMSLSAERLAPERGPAGYTAELARPARKLVHAGSSAPLPTARTDARGARLRARGGASAWQASEPVWLPRTTQGGPVTSVYDNQLAPPQTRDQPAASARRSSLPTIAPAAGGRSVGLRKTSASGAGQRFAAVCWGSGSSGVASLWSANPSPERSAQSQPEAFR
jgi:hypothetical protein